jgi:hypothetical protein
LVATLLAVSQKRFASAMFEYGVYRSYSGVVLEWPAPMLLVEGSRYLLVGAGKHGLSEAVRGLDHKSVTLQGSLISRGHYRMLELLPSALQAVGSSSEVFQPVSRGRVSVKGELVDTKCYLGVMNPGEGKVHRGCAVRCISGGVPVALATKNDSGESQLILLVGADDRVLNREVLDFVGEPISISGELLEDGTLSMMRVEPRNFRRE